MMAWRTVLLSMVLVAFTAGCGAKKPEITSLQRKEAAALESEAQFALTLKQFERAEGLLAKAAALTPDAGALWLRLGMTRMRLGQRAQAEAAYKSGLEAFEAAAEIEPENPDVHLEQVTALLLLGRTQQAQKLVTRLEKRFPDSRAVRGFVESKGVDRMLADPRFKELAL